MLHCRGILSVEYVNGDRLWLSVAWITSISAGVRWFRFLYQQEASGRVTLLGDHGYATSGRVVADYGIVMVPKYVGWRFWTLQDYARQVDRAASVNVQIRSTQDLRFRFDHVQMHDVTHMRRRGDLTLVETAVTELRILDLKHPIVRVSVVDRPESLVVRVRVMTVCEQVDIPVPHPGNL